MEKSLIYTDTRLNILSLGNVYVAETDTTSVVEMKEYFMVLDNEITKEEIKINLNKNEYSILKEHFESTHGKELRKIDVEAEDDNLLTCFEVPELEDEMFFATVEEIIDRESDEVFYSITLTDKIENKYNSVELSKEAFIVLHDLCRRHRGA